MLKIDSIIGPPGMGGPKRPVGAVPCPSACKSPLVEAGGFTNGGVRLTRGYCLQFASRLFKDKFSSVTGKLGVRYCGGARARGAGTPVDLYTKGGVNCQLCKDYLPPKPIELGSQALGWKWAIQK